MASIHLFLIALAVTVQVKSCLGQPSLSCSRSLDCDDGDAKTLDICLPRPLFRCRSIKPKSLSDLLKPFNSRPLKLSDRLSIINLASIAFEELNVNLVLYRNLYGFNPIKTLASFARSRRLRKLSNVGFHLAMADIFRRTHDIHCSYNGPPSLSRSVIAALGFFVTDFYTKDGKSNSGRPQRRYMVTDVSDWIDADSGFAAGVEILTWDGLPTEKVVSRLGETSFGSNEAARAARGIRLLTYRSIVSDPLPRGPDVKISFRDRNGSVRQISVKWVIGETVDRNMSSRMRLLSPTVRHIADWGLEETLNVTDVATFRKAYLENVEPGSMNDGEGQPSISVKAKKGSITPIPTDSFLGLFFSAEVVSTNSGSFGRITMWGFFFPPGFLDNIIQEMARVMKLMPKTGLVIDLRGNVGGVADFPKAVMELFTDKIIPPYPFSVRSSRLANELSLEEPVDIADGGKNFIRSYREAVRTAWRAGEHYTGPVGNSFVSDPLRPFPRSKRAYSGPVITLVDGETSSSGDLFTTAQVDNGLSLVVSMDENVAAAGALKGTFRRLFARAFPTVLESPPAGVDFAVPFARFFRGGTRFGGSILENFGVKPDVRYFRTARDVVENDVDLMEFLAKTLAKMS